MSDGPTYDGLTPSGERYKVVSKLSDWRRKDLAKRKRITQEILRSLGRKKSA